MTDKQVDLVISGIMGLGIGLIIAVISAGLAIAVAICLK